MSTKFGGGFSFMLGGRQEDQVWDKEKVTNVLKEQVIFYA